MLKLFNIASLRSLLSGCLLVSFSTALLSLLIGCSHDTDGQLSEEDLVRVNFQVLAHSDADGLLPGESVLNSLRLFVYDASGNLEVNRLLENEKEFSVNSAGSYDIECTLRMSSGIKTLCLVGNEANQSSFLSETSNVSSISNLLANSFWRSSDRPESGSADFSIPFSTHRIWNFSDGNNTIQFDLSRSVGRVDMSLCKEDGLNGNIKLHSIKMIHAARKSQMFSGNLPDTSLADTTTITAFDYSSPRVVGEKNSPYTMPAFYLYEYAPANVADATSLYLTFNVDNGPFKYALIPLAGAKVNDNLIYCIKRNTITQLDLKFLNAKELSVTCVVEDWGDTDYEKVIGDGDEANDSNILYADWISVIYDHELAGHGNPDNDNGGSGGDPDGVVNEWGGSQEYNRELSGKD